VTESRVLRVYAALFYAVLYVPIFVLVLLSFNDSPGIGFPLRGFTGRWYVDTLSRGQLGPALAASFEIGVASATLGTLLALLIALGLRRLSALRGAVLPLLLVPIVTPGIVSGVLMLVFAGVLGVPYGLWTTAFPAHVTWVLPFAFLTLFTRIEMLDGALEEAAMDLGARPWQVFTRVVFPIIRPALLATFTFAFTISFDEFIRTLFLAGTQRTVPIALWVMMQEQSAPYLPAVGVVVMGVSMAVASIGFVISERSDRTPPLQTGNTAS
jgi:spermidine/putrescine transport system permease protein